MTSPGTPCPRAPATARARPGLPGFVLALLLALAVVPSAVAQGISIGWQDCRAGGAGGSNDQPYGCQSSFIEIPLYPGFVLESRIDSVYAMELVIDVAHSEDPLPAWWHMEPFGCRAGAWVADAALAGTCTDAWNGAGTALVQGWLPGEPGGTARHGRLLVAAGVVSDSAVALEAGVSYTACRILLKTTNTLVCAGCEGPACLVFNSLLIRRLPGSTVEEILLATPEVGLAGANIVVWQGGLGADCLAVPARRSTWGAVKALYR